MPIPSASIASVGWILNVELGEFGGIHQVLSFWNHIDIHVKRLNGLLQNIEGHHLEHACVCVCVSRVYQVLRIFQTYSVGGLVNLLQAEVKRSRLKRHGGNGERERRIALSRLV